MSIVIDTRALCKDYGAGRGCKDITLRVTSGQVFGFLGPNGAGKSTFVKMMVGLIRPTAGEAQLLGFPLGDMEVRQRIGYLPELFRYQDWLTGEEVLRFHARLARVERHLIASRIAFTLKLVGLCPRAHERVHHYSKGMQQRLGIACALIHDPELVFLDEPSSALDPLGRHDVRQLLFNLKAEGKTVFLNTHLLEDVEAVCTEVALLLNGAVRECGRVEDILADRMAWLIETAGVDDSIVAVLRGTLGMDISVWAQPEPYRCTLRVVADNREQIGLVNRMLIEEGATVYEVTQHRHRLVDWFVSAALPQGDI